MPEIDIQILPVFRELLTPAPFKVFKGGRGGGKSWQFADATLAKSFEKKHRILCTREYQTSIKDSVHKLLTDRIYHLGMGAYFDITEKSIKNHYTGSEYIFKGLHANENEIKSTEGITVAWCEEGEVIASKSWETLLPTLRTPGVELWISYNPETENNATDLLWIKQPQPGTIVRHVTWRDNPYFPENLDRQRRHCLNIDPVAYEHIWEGGYRKISEAIVFKNRVVVEEFDTPEDARFYFGADWGFSNDPTALIRFYLTGEQGAEELWIDYEAYGHGVEIDDTPALFDLIPASRKWPIKADSARPETISYMARKGFNISPAKKWSGSVEDGIAYMKSFKKIHIHPRCPQIAKETRMYSYKTDKKQVDKDGNPAILPVLVDMWNHGIDATRYGLDGFITNGCTIFDSM